MPGLDDATTALCTKVVRAAFARTLSDAYDLPLAKDGIERVGVPHLACVQYGQIGYYMGDSLVPIINMVNGKGRISEDSDAPSNSITTYDELLDETNAHLHDRLLNLSPKFEPEIQVLENPILNVAYEDILATSEFAGTIQLDNAQVVAARELLFPMGDHGFPVKSAVYEAYESYAQQVDEITLQIAEAQLNETQEKVRSLENKRLRLMAEWSNLGQKRRVEDALSTLAGADASAGFEDERVRFQEILAARTRQRISSALSYAAVNISPLSALTDPDATSFWTDATLNGESIRSAISPEVRLAFGITPSELSQVADLIKSAQISHTMVVLDREWLRDEFLNARYWRHETKVLSDGKGSGLAPTVATRACFVRAARFVVRGELMASEGAQLTATPSLIKAMPTKTPLLKMLADNSNQLTAKQNVKPAAARQQKKTLQKVLFHQQKEQNRVKAINAPKISLAPNRAAHMASSAPSVNVRTARAVPAARVTGTVRGATAVRAVNPGIRPQQVNLRRIHPAQVNQSKPANVLTVQGTIHVQGDIDLSAGRIVLLHRRLSGSRTIAEDAFRLQADGSKGFRFAGTFPQTYVNVTQKNGQMRRRRETLTAIELTFHGPSSAMFSKSVQFGAKSRTEQIRLTLSARDTIVELTDMVSPTLMAYGLELLPKAPNPSDEFEWE